MGEKIEQLRDDLAGLMGYGKPGMWKSDINSGMSHITTISLANPIPKSLDWLAEHGLPAGFWFSRVWRLRIDGTWGCHINYLETDKTVMVIEESGPTELHARLAACVSAWKAQAERSGT